MLARHLICAVVLLAGCGADDSSSGDDGPLGGSLTVTGDVVDFQGGAAVSTGVSVTASGITPPPMIATQGSMFTITQVPENSVFQILASATDYRPTFSKVVEVTTDNLSGVSAPVVKNTYVEALAAAFGVTPTTTKGIVIIRLTDTMGNPRAGVRNTDLTLAGSTMGPFFLDANGNAAVGATTSSASGLVVWFECMTGITEAGQTATANITVDMPTSPVAAATVTLADAKIIDGAPPPLPTNVSFKNQVLPVFTSRGCIACHQGNGAGRDLGNLTLGGGANLVYGEVHDEKPNVRVNPAMVDVSLLLTKPLREEPPNHQTATFQNKQDPDYLKFYVWIKEGAKDN